jgi:glycerol uptake facilitator-like aquaporin
VTLIFNIIMGGPLTGAAFNPARALGPMIATSNFNDAWLYLTAPIVGAIAAAIVHTGLARLAHERMAAAEPRSATRTPAE